MPRFKTINFYQDIGLKVDYFLQKNTNFALQSSSLWQVRTLPLNSQNSPPLYISDCVHESNRVFALLIFIHTTF